MRTALVALLGLLTGAALGLLTAFLVAWLWPAAGLPMPDEPKAALALMVRTAMASVPLGAVAGAIWFIRRDRAGRRVALIVPGALAALVIAYLVAIALGA